MTEANTTRRPTDNSPRGQSASMPPVLAEMMKSFVTLARSENLTAAAGGLGITRQTVRRHIVQLEQLLGCTLLVSGPKGYELTKDGHRHLANASWTLDQMEDWVSGAVDVVGYLQQASVRLEDGGYFCGRQHKLNDVWRVGTNSIQKGLRAWYESQANVEHPLVEEMRPKMVFFRKQQGKWLYIHVGDESTMTRWLGLVWARSEVGSFLEEDTMASDMDRFVTQAYDQTLARGTVRYDHIATTLARSRNGPLEPVSYQRLILAYRLPDGSPVLGVLIIVTDDIEVGMPTDFQLLPMPADMVTSDG